MVPGVGQHASLLAKAVLDSRADISSIPQILCSFLELKFPRDPIRRILVESPRYARLNIGQPVAVDQRPVPLGLKLHTAPGPVRANKPQVFCLRSWDDINLIQGGAPWKCSGSLLILIWTGLFAASFNSHSGPISGMGDVGSVWLSWRRILRSHGFWNQRE